MKHKMVSEPVATATGFLGAHASEWLHRTGKVLWANYKPGGSPPSSSES